MIGNLPLTSSIELQICAPTQLGGVESNLGASIRFAN